MQGEFYYYYSLLSFLQQLQCIPTYYVLLFFIAVTLISFTFYRNNNDTYTK